MESNKILNIFSIAMLVLAVIFLLLKQEDKAQTIMLVILILRDAWRVK